MSNDIVTTNVSVIAASAPSLLQQTGAIISQGGTTTDADTSSLLTQASDLTALLTAAVSVDSIAYSAGTVTADVTAGHGYTVGTSMWLTLEGFTPSDYDGDYLCTFDTTTSFTYALTSDPGTATVMGTYVPLSVTELNQYVTTFFAQGSTTPVYVLELGAGDPAAGVTALTAWITANPSTDYSYTVPRPWADESTFVTMAGNYTSDESKTYFFVTVDADNYDDFADLKSVISMVESPDVASTEMSIAAAHYVALHYNPSSTNRVTPYSFSYLYGVTNYPLKGNSSTLATYKAANVNYIDTGAEGGDSNYILKWGTTMDGEDFNFWYSVDWSQVECSRTISATIIAGSNSVINPLYYNQSGINRLQDVVANKMKSGQEYGLVYGDVVKTTLTASALADAIDAGTYEGKTIVNAVPMASYSSSNPTHYALGRYDGLTVVYAPQKGFRQIVFNIQVTDLVAA